jgi:hypothetical protein
MAEQNHTLLHQQRADHFDDDVDVQVAQKQIGIGSRLPVVFGDVQHKVTVLEQTEKLGHGCGDEPTSRELHRSASNRGFDRLECAVASYKGI